MTTYTVKVQRISTATIKVEAERSRDAIREAESIASDDPHLEWTCDCVDACSCDEAGVEGTQ